jgi:tetratricopeptide (TPR) repeat protein
MTASLKECMAAATAAFQKSDFEGALEHFSAAAKLTENKSYLCTINTNKGAALQRLARFDEAVAAFNAALDARPDYLQALFNNGVTLKALERHEEALGMFERALEKNAEFYPALCGKSEVLVVLDRHAEAVAAATAAIAVEPETPTAYVDRAFAHLKNSAFKDAVADYERSQMKNPETTKLHAIALSHWATELDKAGKVKESLKQMNKAKKMEKTEHRVFTCALLEYQLEKWDLSLAHFAEVLEMNPGHADAKAASGNIHIHEERFPEALEMLKQAKAQLDEVTVMPHPSLLQNLGVAYLRTGDPISAREVFEEILVLDPENSQAKLALHAVQESVDDSAGILRADQTGGAKANPNATADDGEEEDSGDDVVDDGEWTGNNNL